MTKQCTTQKYFHFYEHATVKKNCGGYCRRVKGSLFAEGLAVGALVHGGVSLMGADHDAVQRAVVLGVAMVSALLDGTLDALVCMTVHIHFLLLD